MANLKSSLKDIRRTEKRTAQNRAPRSKVRTILKSAKLAFDSSVSLADLMLKIVAFESAGMKLARKGVISKKSVSRKVSALVIAAKKKFSNVA